MAREVRKTVTILFADVAGSTELGELLDPEALRRVLARWFDGARGVLERHGGTVEKFIGDAVMAVFGVPQAHDDDAWRSVRAAAELRERMSELNHGLERDFGVLLAARIGINTGEVVAGTEERLVTGDAVNIASRLEHAAEPGEIVLGDATYRLVREAVDAEPLRLTVAGKTDAVDAHRLLRIVEGATPLPRRDDVRLVGRLDELGELRLAFDSAVSERACRVVTVVGPPGIGKSRLAAELTRRVDAEATVLTGRCLAYGEGITYWPLVEIVRAAAHHEARARIIELLRGEPDAELIADRLAAAVGSGGEGAAGSEEIFWAVRRLFERLARERPLVVLLEDIHWGAPTFLDLLEYLAGWTADAAVLLLCLARPDLVEERPSWLGVGRTIELAPLSPEESRTLVEGLGNGALDDQARARIVERAEGNPLFVEQLLAMAVEGEEEVPPSIQAVLAARLDRLAPAEREVLERASVIGREFWRGAVAALSPPAEREQLTPALLALARKGLVQPERSVFPDEDGFRFHHALIRDVAYDGIAKTTRAELHERVGRWLEAKGLELEQEHGEIVGYHLEQAYLYRADLGDRDPRLAAEAAERLISSGNLALARSDMRAAVNLLERASALLAASDRRRIEAAPQLASALRMTGALERAEAVLEEAVTEASLLGDERLRARARVVQLDLQLARPEAEPDAIRSEAEALRDVFERVGDDFGLALTWGLVAAVAWLEGHAADTAGAVDRGIEYCDRVGAVAERANQLEMQIMTLSHGPTPVAEAISRTREALEEGNRTPVLASAAERALGRLLAMRGQFEDARLHMRRGLETLDDLGLSTLLAASSGMGVAFIESLAGDLNAAERALRESCDRLEETGEHSFLSTAAADLAAVLFDKASIDEAERFTQISERFAAPRDLSSHAQLRSVRARILARRGDLDEAERLAREAVDLVRDADFLNLKAATLLALGDVLRQSGRPDEAAAVAGEVLALLDAKGNVALASRVRQTLSELAAERR